MKYIVMYQPVPKEKVEKLSSAFIKEINGKMVYRTPAKVITHRANGKVSGVSWPKVVNGKLTAVEFCSKDYNTYIKNTVHHCMTDQKSIYCNFAQSEIYEAKNLTDLYNQVKTSK